MEYVGIDLHKKESQICLLTETGEVIERRIRTESQRFAEVLGGRPRARILVEASTESEWVAGASKPWARGRGGGPELRADICPWQGAHVRWGSVVRRATLELSRPAHSWRTRIRDGLPPRALAPAHSIGTPQAVRACPSSNRGFPGSRGPSPTRAATLQMDPSFIGSTWRRPPVSHSPDGAWCCGVPPSYRGCSPIWRGMPIRRGKAASNSKNTGAFLGFKAQASVIAR
jgi:hypothetical protein